MESKFIPLISEEKLAAYLEDKVSMEDKMQIESVIQSDSDMQSILEDCQIVDESLQSYFNEEFSLSDIDLEIPIMEIQIPEIELYGVTMFDQSEQYGISQLFSNYDDISSGNEDSSAKNDLNGWNDNQNINDGNYSISNDNFIIDDDL